MSETREAELERKLEESMESARFHKSLLDRSHDAIIVWNFRRNEITLWNDGAERLFGYTLEEARAFGDTEREEGGFLSAEYPDGPKGLMAVLLENKEWVGDVGYTAKDGRKITASLRAQLIRGAQGEQQVLMIARDATGRLEAERQLELANQELSRFAHAAAHDLQSPVRTIGSLLQVIQEQLGSTLDEQTGRWMGMVLESSQRMAALIAGLLEFAELGSLAATEEVSLEAITSSVLDDLRAEVETSGAQVGLGELPQVRAPAQALSRVIQNLVSNALKYCEESPIVEISAQIDGDWVYVSVADNGIGIEAQYHEQIFDAFRRLHTSSEYPGSGIGLCTVSRLVAAWGGTIQVVSEPQHGSTFTFTVPAVPAKEDPPEA